MTEASYVVTILEGDKGTSVVTVKSDYDEPESESLTHLPDVGWYDGVVKAPDGLTAVRKAMKLLERSA